MTRPALALACLLALAACKEDKAASLPPAVVMTEAALGYYCQMNLTEHPGPKGQIHLAGLPVPIFFSQVRDAIAYQRMPEQSHAITAVYVSDMGAAPSWESPGASNWIPAAEAHFVIGSRARGGMGAAEVVPFADPAKAAAFAAEHGGRVARLDEIADADVLGPAPDPAADPAAGPEGADFIERLERLNDGGQG